MPKKYADPDYYEKKLEKVMERFQVSDYSYNWDRFRCWIEFRYKGEPYMFEHSVENAKDHGQNIVYGSDSFAQLVMTLEDLARMIERGIYDLQRWVAGMKFLPPAVEIPACFKFLGFTEIPISKEEVKNRYQGLAKVHHPDAGGSSEEFQKLTTAYEQSVKHLDATRKR